MPAIQGWNDDFGFADDRLGPPPEPPTPAEVEAVRAAVERYAEETDDPDEVTADLLATMGLAAT